MLANQYLSDGHRAISSLPSLRETPNGQACESKTVFPIVVLMHVAGAETGGATFQDRILKSTARRSWTAGSESIQLLAASFRRRARAMQIGRHEVTAQEIMVRNGSRVRPSEAASKLLSLRYLPWWRWHLHSCSTGVISGIRARPCSASRSAGAQE